VIVRIDNAIREITNQKSQKGLDGKSLIPKNEIEAADTGGVKAFMQRLGAKVMQR
jgi:hypothetical protein